MMQLAAARHAVRFEAAGFKMIVVHVVVGTQIVLVLRGQVAADGYLIAGFGTGIPVVVTRRGVQRELFVAAESFVVGERHGVIGSFAGAPEIHATVFIVTVIE